MGLLLVQGIVFGLNQAGGPICRLSEVKRIDSLTSSIRLAFFFECDSEERSSTGSRLTFGGGDGDRRRSFTRCFPFETGGGGGGDSDASRGSYLTS